MKSYKKYTLVLLVIFFVLSSFLIGSKFVGFKDFANSAQKDEIQQKLKDKLLLEFGNAYNESIKPTGNVKEINIRASQEDFQLVNEVTNKLFTYNSQIPGPIIRIQKGDTLKVNFQNDLPQETTIHWHGVRVPNDMDGVPGVTQETVKPSEKFVYEFTPKDAGTFWFHPHVRSAEQVEKAKEALERELEEEFMIKVKQDDLEEFGVYTAQAAGQEHRTVKMEVEQLRWIDSNIPEDIMVGSIFEHDVIPELKARGLIT